MIFPPSATRNSPSSSVRFPAERMEFFHFGPGSLFGSFSPPPPGGKPGSVVVLCYPFGQEYMRAHRAFRQIASLVTRFGLPVLRFDYYGTGDSPGWGDETSLNGWIDDIRAAMGEARRRSGAPLVRLAGLRLGAAAAALASQGSEEVERLVLWDPVVRGGAFLEEIAEDGVTKVGSTWWMNGFPLSQQLRKEIDAVDLHNIDVDPPAGVFQMISHRNQDFQALSEALRSRSVNEETRLIPSPSDWNYSDDVGGILLPREMVRGIVDVLVG